MKFLIIRFSSIGDIVLTTPVIRCLKQQLLSAEIHFATRAAFRDIVEPNPYIDKLHYLKDDLNELIAELRLEDFDYVIDLHHNLRTLKVKRALKRQSFSFKKLNVEKWLMTALKINRLPATHIVQRYLDTLKPLGVFDDGLGLDYFIPEKDIVPVSDIPVSHQAGYVACVIGAALNTKRYPLHKWKEVCKRLDHPIIIMGGKDDAAAGAELEAIDPYKIYNACGKFRLNESADLVRRSKMVVTNDTGLMHIASAFRKPIISLWGNTIPEFGMYPYFGTRDAGKQSFDVLETKELSCRPCSKIGYSKCPRGHFKCMENIEVETVLAAIQKRR